MPSETSSSAGAQAPQEPTAKVGAQPTTSPPASEGQVAPAREQVTTQPPRPTAEQIAELLQSREAQALIYRQAQSMKDKELLQERLKRQQEEEQRRLETMDAEEYGQHVRNEQQRQQVLLADRAQLLTHLNEEALSVLSSKSLRDSVAAKAQEAKTFPDFLRAVMGAEIQHQVQNQMSKKEKELRDAISKELMGEQVGEIAPDLGRGLPTSRTPRLHGDRAIAAGLTERLKASQKK